MGFTEKMDRIAVDSHESPMHVERRLRRGDWAKASMRKPAGGGTRLVVSDTLPEWTK